MKNLGQPFWKKLGINPVMGNLYYKNMLIELLLLLWRKQVGCQEDACLNQIWFSFNRKTMFNSTYYFCCFHANWMQARAILLVCCIFWPCICKNFDEKMKQNEQTLVDTNVVKIVLFILSFLLCNILSIHVMTVRCGDCLTTRWLTEWLCKEM